MPCEGARVAEEAWLPALSRKGAVSEEYVGNGPQWLLGPLQGRGSWANDHPDPGLRRTGEPIQAYVFFRCSCQERQVGLDGQLLSRCAPRYVSCCRLADVECPRSGAFRSECAPSLKFALKNRGYLMV